MEFYLMLFMRDDLAAGLEGPFLQKKVGEIRLKFGSFSNSLHTAPSALKSADLTRYLPTHTRVGVPLELRGDDPFLFQIARFKCWI